MMIVEIIINKWNKLPQLYSQKRSIQFFKCEDFFFNYSNSLWPNLFILLATINYFSVITIKLSIFIWLKQSIFNDIIKSNQLQSIYKCWTIQYVWIIYEPISLMRLLCLFLYVLVQYVWEHNYNKFFFFDHHTRVVKINCPISFFSSMVWCFLQFCFPKKIIMMSLNRIVMCCDI